MSPPLVETWRQPHAVIVEYDSFLIIIIVGVMDLPSASGPSRRISRIRRAVGAPGAARDSPVVVGTLGRGRSIEELTFRGS